METISIWHFLIISLLIQLILFIPAYRYKTDKLTDLSYSITFIILSIAAFNLSDSSSLKFLISIMVTIWGLRLGTFLFIRIRRMEKDKRFDGIRESFLRFSKFWFLQGVAVWVIMLPTLLFMQSDPLFTELTLIGFTIWLIGLLFESIADMQKYRFKQNPKNKGKWIQTGLWKYSRHPNYFGEILVWLGIYIFTLSSLSDINAILGVISPAFIILLLIFGTGIPQLEAYANKKWGSNKDYQKYKKTTSILVPWIVKEK